MTNLALFCAAARQLTLFGYDAACGNWIRHGRGANSLSETHIGPPSSQRTSTPTGSRCGGPGLGYGGIAAVSKLSGISRVTLHKALDELEKEPLLEGWSRMLEEETAGVFNDAYMKLHSALDEVRPATVRQFLGLAALEVRRVLLDRIRKMRGRGQRKRPQMLSLQDKQSEDAPDHAVADPDGDPARLTLALDLLEAIEGLPDDEREVVELKFFSGLTEVEAGKILAVHEDTVKRRWSRARIKLADKLAPFAPEQ